MTTNLGFIRMAAADGVHDPQEIETNNTNGDKTMNRRISRRIKVAFERAKRDPLAVANFITDVLLVTGIFALVVISYRTAVMLEVVY